MKKLITLLVLCAIGSSYSYAQYVDDLYVTTSDKKKEAQRQKELKQEQARQNELWYEQQQKREQQRQYQERQQQQYREPSNSNSSGVKYDEYVDDVHSAYQRRQDALTSSSTNSASYWESMDEYYNYLERKYDQDLYNIIVLNDKIWVEPKFITSIFDGTDASEQLNGYKNRMAKNFIQQKRNSSSNSGNYNSSNVTVNINVSPYYSGWNNPWSWNYGSSWSWGGGYYGGYYGGYSNPWYSPYWGGGWGYPVIIDRHPTYYGNSRYGNSGRYRGNGSNHLEYNNGGGGSYRPGYGVSGVKPSERPAVRPGTALPGRDNGYSRPSYDRPSNNNDRPSYRPQPEQPSNNNRPQYERPSRQENPYSRPTYERPTTDRPSYDRPSAPASMPSAPAGGGGGGGRLPSGGGRSR